MEKTTGNFVPFFSVITVVFNDLEGLRRTQASVEMQTDSNFEWVVVDGGSTDGTVEFIRSLDLPCLKWSSERDRGIYDAMNKGTHLAQGGYVIYLNAGDSFTDKNCLSDVKSILSASGLPELCYAGCNYQFSDGSLRYRAPRQFEKAIRYGMPAMHQATFYRRDFLEKEPYSLKYPVSADYFISARCYLRGARACYLNRAISYFGVGGNSTKKINQVLIESWQIQRDVLKINLIERTVGAIRRFLVHRLMLVLYYFIHASGGDAVKTSDEIRPTG
jgi:putative colanic acid biosynthesis glycosyltransferase